MTEETAEEKTVEEKPKSISVKQYVAALVTAFAQIQTICDYEVMRKDYPSDLKLFFNNGRERITNPTLVDYIARAEKVIVEQEIDKVLSLAAAMLGDDLQEIKDDLYKINGLQ